jgi:hypothetical protein
LPGTEVETGRNDGSEAIKVELAADIVMVIWFDVEPLLTALAGDASL